LQDIRDLIGRIGVVGAAAGSLFVFKGTYRAVLINYPNRATKDALFAADGGAAVRPGATGTCL
jgi:cyclase